MSPPAPFEEADPELANLEDAELEQIKIDLEQRLARFQKAFYSQHGRNPNEEERKPAKPAIRKYRQVCGELARRHKARAQGSPGAATFEVAAGAAQTGGSLHSSAAAERSLTRRAKEAGQRMAQFTSTMGGSATFSLIMDWGQLTAIWGDVSLATALKLREQNPELDIDAIASWLGVLESSVWRWVQIFNLDIEAFRANFDFTFLSTIGWREIHLFCTVVLPLMISAVTVCLLRSIGDIARLALLTVSGLLLVFGASAHVILARGTAIRDTEETAILGIDQSSLNWTLGVGGAMFLLAVALMVYLRFATYRMVRRYLESEVDSLSNQLFDIKDKAMDFKDRTGGGGGGGGGGASAAEVAEELPNAKELEEMLESDHHNHFVGGRAGDVVEFARQMAEKEKAKQLESGQHAGLPDFLSFVRMLTVWLLLSCVALLLWLRVAELLPESMLLSMSASYNNNYYVGAVIFSAAALVLLAYLLLSLTPTGQTFVDHIVELLKAGYVGFLMLVVLVLYIPISRQAISVFICDTHTCGLGEWFPVQSPGTDATLSTYLNNFADSYTSIARSFSDGANSTSPSSAAVQALGPPTSCVGCHWLGGPATDASGGAYCPAALANELCAPSTSLRLAASPSIDCWQQWAFYMPGALLTILMFTIGVPYMFYQLTHRHTKMYESLDIYVEAKKSPAKRRAATSSSPARGARSVLDVFRASTGMHHDYTQWEIDDLWLRRVRQAKRNRAKNLYADFEYDWRYWKLVILGVKFLVVLIDALTSQFASPLVSPVLMLAIHASMLVLSAYARPYTDKRPDLFALTLSLANVVNWSLLFIFAAQITAPAWVIWLLLVVNVVLPIGSLFAGYCLNRVKARQQQARHVANAAGKQYVGEKEVVGKRKSIERMINDFTLRFISRWTWGVLLCCVLGGELIFIGTFAEAALSPVTGHTASRDVVSGVVDCHREEFARAQEFIGFGSWQNFTQSCCCMSRANVTDTSAAALDDHLVELWACVRPSGDTRIVYKERQRRDLDPGATVAPVRGFCSTHFRNPNDWSDPYGDSGQVPEWNGDRNKLGVWTYFANGTADTFYDDFW